MLTFTQRKTPHPDPIVTLSLSLTAEERTRSRHKFILADQKEVFLRLARGTVLHDGDILTNENESIYMRIIAKPEPVLTVLAEIPLLLRAAYH
ncbi:MAG: urease accessory protein UreE, partial [Cuspidothrix sp.]